MNNSTACFRINKFDFFLGIFMQNNFKTRTKILLILYDIKDVHEKSVVKDPFYVKILYGYSQSHKLSIPLQISSDFQF